MANCHDTYGSAIAVAGDSGPAPSSGVRAMMKILQSAGEVSCMNKKLGTGVSHATAPIGMIK